jgi:hypothetical protein
LESVVSYQLEVTDEKDYVHVKFRGDLTVDNEKQVIKDIYSKVAQSGQKNVLVDRRAGHLEPSAKSNYEEAKFISELPDLQRYRFAVLFRPEDIEQALLLEAIATNRGVNWKFFKSEEEAIEWIAMPVV